MSERHAFCVLQGVPRIRPIVELLVECGLANVSLIPLPNCADIHASGQVRALFTAESVLNFLFLELSNLIWNDAGP